LGSGDRRIQDIFRARLAVRSHDFSHAATLITSDFFNSPTYPKLCPGDPVHTAVTELLAIVEAYGQHEVKMQCAAITGNAWSLVDSATFKGEAKSLEALKQLAAPPENSADDDDPFGDSDDEQTNRAGPLGEDPLISEACDTILELQSKGRRSTARLKNWQLEPVSTNLTGKKWPPYAPPVPTSLSFEGEEREAFYVPVQDLEGFEEWLEASTEASKSAQAPARRGLGAIDDDDDDDDFEEDVFSPSPKPSDGPDSPIGAGTAIDLAAPPAAQLGGSEATPEATADPFAAVTGGDDPFAGGNASADLFAEAASTEGEDPFAGAADPFSADASSADPFGSEGATSGGDVGADPFATAAAEGGADPFAAAEGGADPFAAVGEDPFGSGGDPFSTGASTDDAFSAGGAATREEPGTQSAEQQALGGVAKKLVESSGANAQELLTLHSEIAAALDALGGLEVELSPELHDGKWWPTEKWGLLQHLVKRHALLLECLQTAVRWPPRQMPPYDELDALEAAMDGLQGKLEQMLKEHAIDQGRCEALHMALDGSLLAKVRQQSTRLAYRYLSIALAAYTHYTKTAGGTALPPKVLETLEKAANFTLIKVYKFAGGLDKNSKDLLSRVNAILSALRSQPSF